TTASGAASEVNQPAGTACTGAMGPSACDAAGNCGECAPGAVSCNGDTRQVCGSTGVFEDVESCEHGCDAGACYADCRPDSDARRCSNANTLQVCSDAGEWGATTACEHGCDFTTLACYSACTPDSRR